MTKWTTPAYVKLLKGSLEVYGTADTKERASIVKEIKRQIRDLAKAAQDHPPDGLNQVKQNFTHLIHLCFDALLLQKIRNWLHNHRRVEAGMDNGSDSEPGQKPGLTIWKRKRWTFQGVVEQHEKEKINARAEELSKAERGTIDFLSAYRRARTQVCQELSTQEQLEFEGLAEKWNTEPVPPNIQREWVNLCTFIHLQLMSAASITVRLASRKFMHNALEFSRLAKEQMGVEIFMLAGWQDDKGQIKKAKWVFSNEMFHILD
jgi:hypothetical protein